MLPIDLPFLTGTRRAPSASAARWLRQSRSNTLRTAYSGRLVSASEMTIHAAISGPPNCLDNGRRPTPRTSGMDRTGLERRRKATPGVTMANEVGRKEDVLKRRVIASMENLKLSG